MTGFRVIQVYKSVLRRTVRATVRHGLRRQTCTRAINAIQVMPITDAASGPCAGPPPLPFPIAGCVFFSPRFARHWLCESYVFEHSSNTLWCLATNDSFRPTSSEARKEEKELKNYRCGLLQCSDDRKRLKLMRDILLASIAEGCVTTKQRTW